MRILLVLLLISLAFPLILTANEPKADKPDASLPAIQELARPTVKDNAFRRERPPQPIVLKSAKEALEYLTEKEAAKLTKEVDFKHQVILLFAWRGSGGDRLSSAVAESYPEQITFEYKEGLTKDLREHVLTYAVRSNVKWKVAGKD